MRATEILAQSPTAGFVEQARLLTSALNSISQGLCMCDEQGVVILVNGKFIEMYGLSPDIVRPGCTLMDVLYHRKERNILSADPVEYSQKLLAAIEANEVNVWTTEESGNRSFRVVTSRTPNGGWVSTHEEITDIRRREQSFKHLFQANPTPMWVYDIQSLRFLAVNDAALSHYGYTSEKFLSLTVPELNPNENQEDVRAFIVANTSGGPRKVRSRHRKADGTFIDVFVHSSPILHEGVAARLVATHDLTDIFRAEAEVLSAQRFFESLIDNVPMPIMVKDAVDLRFTLLNKAAGALFGVPRERMLGKTPWEVHTAESAELVAQGDRAVLESDDEFVLAAHKIDTAIGPRYVTTRKLAIRNEKDEKTHILTVLNDVTEQINDQAKIVHLAHHDALTGLPNRVAFNNELERAAQLAERDGDDLAILCLDLDGFKEVNDLYGHTTGDILLRQVADRLRLVSERLYLSRFGGDEFMAFIRADRRQVEELAQALAAAVARDFEIGGQSLKAGLSIGVALMPEHGADVQTLLQHADTALYRAKAQARGSLKFFEPQMAVELKRRRLLQSSLEVALDHGGITLDYQPQFTICGNLVGMEALARWNSPEGDIPPNIFVPLAEQCGLILPLGEFILRQACLDAKSWEGNARVSVNISPAQFRRTDLPALVHTILMETGLTPSRLELEVTENVLIEDTSKALSILRRLKSLGVTIALDDFGTGYSSLSYLHVFPFDRIKLDRSFVQDIGVSMPAYAIVQAVIGLAHRLSISVVAEGVETQAQLDILRNEGCDMVQGFLTGRPQPIEKWSELLNSVGPSMLVPVDINEAKKRPIAKVSR